MNQPWNKFVLATGEVEDLNLIAQKLIDEFVEHNPDKMPTKIVIGLDWGFEDATSYWGGYVGELKLERVPGSEVRVE